MNIYLPIPDHFIWNADQFLNWQGIAEPHLQLTTRVYTNPSFVTADLFVTKQLEPLLNKSMNARNCDANGTIANLPFVEIRSIPDPVVPQSGTTAVTSLVGV